MYTTYIVYRYFRLSQRDGAAQVRQQRGKTGPSNTKRVVWATKVRSFFLYKFYGYYLLYIGTVNVLKGWGKLGKATRGKMGPSDTKRVVWAINVRSFFLLYFMDTTYGTQVP